MLFNWILKGFNSTLTDIDVENITQFILKYITKEEDVLILMNSLNDAFKEIYAFATDDKLDIKDVAVQKLRKSVLKKSETLSKIISNLQNYYLKHVGFFE